MLLPPPQFSFSFVMMALNKRPAVSRNRIGNMALGSSARFNWILFNWRHDLYFVHFCWFGMTDAFRWQEKLFTPPYFWVAFLTPTYPVQSLQMCIMSLFHFPQIVIPGAECGNDPKSGRHYFDLFHFIRRSSLYQPPVYEVLPRNR